MAPAILSLHHVTATVDDAQADLDFCAGTLGLRLVKRTVNFDNHYVYHFYYGNRQGTPGTLWTTFPYKGHGVPIGRKGAGQITTTSFSVPGDALAFWRRRLDARGISVTNAPERFGEPALICADPSGLVFELAGTRRDDRTPWTSPTVPADTAVRGLHGVTLSIASPPATVAFLTDALGFATMDAARGRTRLTVGQGRPGQTVDIVDASGEPRAANGLGTVHHVALAVATPEEQADIRADLVARGLSVTPVRDRQYFQSIYFREPGGVLLEIATVPPGFVIDESLENLGQSLKLPPWEEPNRADIEGGSRPCGHPVDVGRPAQGTARRDGRRAARDRPDRRDHGPRPARDTGVDPDARAAARFPRRHLPGPGRRQPDVVSA